MAKKKIFTDESLATFVDEIKAYTDEAVSAKANSSHNHSASNITSGTLSSDRLPTVPITKGGTGATTAAGALTNLGLTATAAELNKMDGVTATTTELNYVDGVTSNIQTQLDGKASSSHTHNYAGSSSAGGAATSANKVNSSLTVKLNSGTTEGTNMFTFNGSAAKSVNITPSAIGAAASSHTHDDRYYTESEIDTKLSGKANSSHTHTKSQIADLTTATTSTDGLMPSTDKTKLNGIEAGAQKNVVTNVVVLNTGGTQRSVEFTTADGTKFYAANTFDGLAVSPHVLPDATTSVKGAMSHTDKAKLDGIATGANNYTLPTASSTLGGVKTTSTVTSTSGLTACPIISGVPYYKDTNTTYTHPTTSGNKHIPSGGSSGQILRWSADGTAVWGNDNNTTYSAATTSAAGLMSAADKTKLNGIATGANKYTHPSYSTTNSSSNIENLVQGDVITYVNAITADNGHVTKYQKAQSRIPIHYFASARGSASSLSLSASTITSLTLNTWVAKSTAVIGDTDFSFSGGGIKCPKAGNILISGSVYFNSNSGVRGVYIMKGSTEVLATYGNSAGLNGGVTSGTAIITVAAGDIIYLKARNNTATTCVPNNASTCLNIGYID